MSFFFNRSLDLDERSDQTRALISAFIGWCSVFLLIDKKFKFKSVSKAVGNDIKNRIISMMHGFLTFSAALYVVTFYQTHLAGPNTPEIIMIVIGSMSYFLYDLLACIYYDLSDTGLLLHHSTAILGYANVLVLKLGATLSIYGLLCAEISNLPMHLRVILRNLNLRYTLLYETCEYMYFGSYLVFRGFVFPCILAMSIFETNIPLLTKASGLVLNIQSVYYIFEMKKIYKRLRSQLKERKQKGIVFEWLSVPENVYTLSYVKQKQNKDKIF